MVEGMGEGMLDSAMQAMKKGNLTNRRYTPGKLTGEFAKTVLSTGELAGKLFTKLSTSTTLCVGLHCPSSFGVRTIISPPPVLDGFCSGSDGTKCSSGRGISYVSDDSKETDGPFRWSLFVASAT